MRFALPLSMLALLTVTGSNANVRPVLRTTAVLTAERVLLAPGDVERTRVGALTYLGGVKLRSPDPAFGGFSAMRVEGDRFTLLSDAGNIVEFTLGADWQPRDARFADLPGPGTGWYKRYRDAESLTVDPETGRVWVAFEWQDAIWRYDRTLSRVEASVRPPAMADWPVASGPEAMVRLRGGSFLVFAEGDRPKGQPNARTVLHFASDPTVTKRPPLSYAYVPPAGYSPVDAAELPDGRLLVLNRRFSVPALFTAKLTLVDPRSVKLGGAMRGVELASFEPPFQHDNFEALAITREGTDTILWIATDDNQQFWEESLLLKFRLEFTKSPPPAPGTGSRE